jgi:hypothetical protein
MRRFGSLGLAVAAAFAVVLFADRARADIVLYDKDGWGFYTRGQVAAFYQLALGDADPTQTTALGGTFNSGSLSNMQNNSVTLSRVRSGYIGSQIGFGIRRDISDTVHVDSLLDVSLQDISGGRNIGPPEGVDFREAWASVVTPYGSFKFGRMYSIFGSASTDVMLLAYRYGIGNPCTADGANIGCGSVGAGVLFAGYNAEMRYITPRLAGFEAQLSLGDPIEGQAANAYALTPLPRFDGEINYDQHFGETTRLRVIAQGMAEEMQRNYMGGLQSATPWGVMGSAIFEAGGFAVGAGGWEGSGIGTTSILFLAEGGTVSESFDSTGALRLFRGYFGNIAYDYHGSRLAAGTGISYVQPTTQDESAGGGGIDILDHAAEWHVVFTQKIDAIVLDAEYARWTTRWHSDTVEVMNLMAVGANFNW